MVGWSDDDDPAANIITDSADTSRTTGASKLFSISADELSQSSIVVTSIIADLRHRRRKHKGLKIQGTRTPLSDVCSNLW
jgi:hypothetical protein